MTRTIYIVSEWTKSPATAKKYFKNRKIKGARIIKTKKVKMGKYVHTDIYFTKGKKKRR